jgi:hypothetical protein
MPPGRLKGAQVRRLQEAILSAFDSAALQRLLRVHLEEDLRVIVGAGPLEHVIFDLIDWAEKQGRIAELVRSIKEERPNNQLVQAITDELLSNRGGGQAIPPPAGTPLPRRHPGTFKPSGKVKVEYTQRLLDDWHKLADCLGVSPADQKRFEQGLQARDIWDWLEVRGRLHELPEALRVIDRPDLADLLEIDPGTRQ